MSDFDELVREAELAPIEGWDFSWLDGRAFEERPSWRYFDRVADRAATVASLLEVQAGVGSMIGSLPSLRSLFVATEGFPPGVAFAAPRLRARGVHLIVTSQTRAGLPFAAESFELVVSRHPIEPWWAEIARVLEPGGSYFAQHVGPHSLRSLSELLMGPLPESSKLPMDARNRISSESDSAALAPLVGASVGDADWAPSGSSGRSWLCPGGGGVATWKWRGPGP